MFYSFFTHYLAPRPKPCIRLSHFFPFGSCTRALFDCNCMQSISALTEYLTAPCGSCAVRRTKTLAFSNILHSTTYYTTPSTGTWTPGHAHGGQLRPRNACDGVVSWMPTFSVSPRCMAFLTNPRIQWNIVFLCIPCFFSFGPPRTMMRGALTSSPCTSYRLMEAGIVCRSEHPFKIGVTVEQVDFRCAPSSRMPPPRP